MFGFKRKQEHTLEIFSPIQGTTRSLDEVEDEAFSSRALGDGFAVEPSEGKVTAPFSGKIAHFMEKSKHALILEHDSGVQILIHVGMNTVSLKGEGFTAHVQTGDRVVQGQVLLEFDIPLIKKAGYELLSPVIVPNGQEIVKEVQVLGKGADLMIKVKY
ncbi:PTS system, glucose-specific IIA component [Paenibacillus sp. ov031]|uniref:PTS sugar transporter subunit IIA n=1 Tax=Paenibacillus sp. ov031 TaxID=1761879 RepID=UPI0009162320|nr:PTS glucose transporter subunit IIA [Paenibacillus sp. ov031]SHN61149.1 PTS system, glucose-specific IIA component [Paenibacillus sp. ov031]